MDKDTIEARGNMGGIVQNKKKEHNQNRPFYYKYKTQQEMRSSLHK